MSDFRMKGVLDRFGGIEWIFFHASTGLSRPLAVLGDYEITQITRDMAEQREDLDALRMKEKPDVPNRRGRGRGKAIDGELPS